MGEASRVVQVFRSNLKRMAPNAASSDSCVTLPIVFAHNLSIDYVIPGTGNDGGGFESGAGLSLKLKTNGP